VAETFHNSKVVGNFRQFIAQSVGGAGSGVNNACVDDVA
jgi:hypothetical protein